MPGKTLFLPGAGGSASFWRPVADRMGIEGAFFSWPGLGHEAPDPDINGFDDLVAMVVEQIDGPVDIVAQSMGGVIAIRAALAKPQFIRRLVLAVTSGGLPLDELGLRTGAMTTFDYSLTRRSGSVRPVPTFPKRSGRSRLRLCCCGVIAIRSARSRSGSGSANCCRDRNCM